MRSPTVIVSDEFPAGYSSAGCSPAEPASAFPDVDILLDERKKVVEDYSEWGSVFIPRVSPEGFTPPICVYRFSSVGQCEARGEATMLSWA
jgi:hypothetical protein